jgi:tetratricopeptide (TPR) repeat protein
MTEQVRTYRAFVSYSHRDKAVAAWVQRALERYRVPKKLVGRETAVGVVPARLHPLFRDREELPASSDLGSQLREALQNALFLIVICSPAAARSRWVNEEILNFKRMHGEGRVLALICDGEPGSADAECFPDALKYRLGPDGELGEVEAEPIAADIRPGADGRRLAKFKLIAGVTGLRLDDLMRRENARRARRLAAIATASTIGMVLALALAFYANTQRIAADHQRRVAERESAAARAAADYLVGTFELSNPATENPKTITAFTILGRSAERARTELADQPDLQARMLATVALAYANLGLLTEAQNALARSMPAINQAGTSGANALATLAMVQYRQGDLDLSIRTARTALARLGSGGTDDEARLVRARTLEIMASALTGQQHRDQALAAYNKAIEVYESSKIDSRKKLAVTYNNRGLLLADMGLYDQARASLMKSYVIIHQIYPHGHIIEGQNYYALGLNDYLAGHLESADANIARALAIYGRVTDPTNLVNAEALSLRGQILRDAKKPAQAEAALKQAVAVYRAAFGKPHYLIGIADVYLALAASDQGHTDQALAYLADAKVNYDASYKKLHPNDGDLLVNKGVILAKAGRKGEARSACAQGLDILARTLGRTDPFYLSSSKTCAGL